MKPDLLGQFHEIIVTFFDNHLLFVLLEELYEDSNSDEFLRYSTIKETRGVAYNSECGLADVGYINEAGLTSGGYTGESRLNGVALTERPQKYWSHKNSIV